MLKTLPRGAAHLAMGRRVLQPDDDDDADVGVGQHGEGHEVLQHHDGHAVGEQLLLRGPVLVTATLRDVGVLGGPLHQARNDGRGEWGAERHEPGEGDDEVALAHGQPPLEWVHDGDVALQADSHQGVGVLEDDDDLEVGGEGAHPGGEGPGVHQHVGDEGDGDANERHQSIGRGQRGDEVVGDAAHVAL